MRTSNEAESYKTRQLERQLAFLERSDTFSEAARLGGGTLNGKVRKFVLPVEYAAENLFPTIRIPANDYFKRHHVTWHRAVAHLLSSQACCLNFLEPFAFEPLALKALLQSILGPIREMLPPEPDNDPGRFVAFEFIGTSDYLNEGKGERTRGANCTSVDAAVRFRTPAGGVEAALIEWKYTESYPPPRPDDPRNKERQSRYKKITFYPDGPVRADSRVDIVDLFAEPIYQLYRQQMLAMQIETQHELEIERVRTILVAPQANAALRSLKIGALQRFGSDVASAWLALLHDPDRFVFCATEELFGQAETVVHEAPSLENWYRYISDRYAFF